MAYILIGSSPYGYPLYRDTVTGECYQDEGDGYLVWYGQCPASVPNSPQLPSISTPGGSSGGVLIQHGGTWYEDLLNTFLGLNAIQQHAPYIPSTNQGAATAQAQASYLQNLAASQAYNPNVRNGSIGAGVGANFGDSIQQFITKNSTLLLVGGVLFVLYKSGRKK